MADFPIFTSTKHGKRVAVNPLLVSAIYESPEGPTDIYTLDCANDKDCWDVDESFDEVMKEINLWQ